MKPTLTCKADKTHALETYRRIRATLGRYAPSDYATEGPAKDRSLALDKQAVAALIGQLRTDGWSTERTAEAYGCSSAKIYALQLGEGCL